MQTVNPTIIIDILNREAGRVTHELRKKFTEKVVVESDSISLYDIQTSGELQTQLFRALDQLATRIRDVAGIPVKTWLIASRHMGFEEATFQVECDCQPKLATKENNETSSGNG